MATSLSQVNVSSSRTGQGLPDLLDIIGHALRPARAVAKATVFMLKVFPMLPSWPVDWVTRPPVMEKVSYPTRVAWSKATFTGQRGAVHFPAFW